MRDDVTSNILTALGADGCIGAWFVRLDIVDDPVYVWTGPHEISWDSKTWTGVGDLGSVSGLTADTKGNITGTEVRLTGIDSTVLSSAKQVKFAGQKGYVWFAVLDQDDFSIIDDPVLIFSGEISGMPITIGQSNRIAASIESRMAMLQKSKPRFRTDEDHQRDFSGDTFFEQVPHVLNKTIYWGLAQSSSTSVTGGGGNRSQIETGDHVRPF